MYRLNNVTNITHDFCRHCKLSYGKPSEMQKIFKLLS